MNTVQIQPIRGSRNAAESPVFKSEDLADIPGLPPGFMHLDECPDDNANHIMKKSVGSEPEYQHVFILGNIDFLNPPNSVHLR